MATILLQAAVAFLGGALGPVGAAIGSAAGAMAGYAIDRALINSTRSVEGPRLSNARPFQAEEGAPLPRVYGSVRLPGHMIWATRFEETRTTSRQGGKGGPRVTEYDYFCNAAFALCEGEIAMVRRIWADGRELDLTQVNIRIHNGAQYQPVDPLLEAKQGAGNTPAYRGVAYAVIDRFALGDFGNRVPQFQFEIVRTTGRLPGQIRAMALLPGSTEYGLFAQPVTRSTVPGVTQQINRHVLHGASDFSTSLDELQALCPALEDVALVVTWFGDDLRIGQCRIRPAVADADPNGYSVPWRAAGLTRETAPVVSTIDTGAAYGGTPADRSVIEAIRAIKARGLRVTLHPFIMMDVPRNNGLPDPWGEPEQAPYPWRGRMTCHPGPGQPGSADKATAAGEQVGQFGGTASADQFSVIGDEVQFNGNAADWGFRRFLLHHAFLAQAAGGVDAFLLGSELRGLTRLRDAASDFPFVETLCALAGEVRDILGPGTGITYGADWSEYFGHQPDDGSGDVFFHLDALWSHPAVSAIGIDNYMPLSDWRDSDYGGANPDGFASPHDVQALRRQIAGGEGYDWYYRDPLDRQNRARTAIADGSYGKDWVFRYKDLAAWWSNPHYNRIGGVEQQSATSWVPRSKPIWFTELGCPAVDRGGNQPNVFPDPKSSENAFPYHSTRGRSDVAQRRFLEAHLGAWDPDSPDFDDSLNPVSPIYGGRMLDHRRVWLWAWDLRPYPAFPMLSEVWSDAQNWLRGHWLNGRLASAPVADLIEAILDDHGLAGDATNIDGAIHGYVAEGANSARTALEPLVALFGVAVTERQGRIHFAGEQAAGAAKVLDELALPDSGAAIERARTSQEDLPAGAELTFLDPFREYQNAVARAVRPDRARVATSSAIALSGSMDRRAAEAAIADWLERRWTDRETLTFSLPPSRLDIEPGTLVTIAGGSSADEYLVTEVEAGLSHQVKARRVARKPPHPWVAELPDSGAKVPAIAGVPLVEFLDLPLMGAAAEPEDRLRLAAFARPWRSQAAFVSPAMSGFVYAAQARAPATMGRLVEPLGPGFEGRVDRRGIRVELYTGEFTSVQRVHLLNGANVAAIRALNGAWEVVQFGVASETAPNRWHLRDLLRGQSGTSDAMAAGADLNASFVLLDEAVVGAGLTAAQIGLALNWRVGAAGLDMSDANFASATVIGGVRARLPLAPVHLRVTRLAGGARLFSWVRRGRIDADRWEGTDIPVGEASERYRLEIKVPGGSPVREVEVDEASWTYPAETIAADLCTGRAVELAVTQLSASAGQGIPARAILDLS